MFMYSWRLWEILKQELNYFRYIENTFDSYDMKHLNLHLQLNDVQVAAPILLVKIADL